MTAATDQPSPAGTGPADGTTEPAGARAVVYTEHGDPEVLTLVTRPPAEPGPGEVRVRIHRSGVNPTDWKSRRGRGPGPVDPPQVPGQDGAGVVDAVGEGVAASRVGERVWVWEAAFGRPDGTLQDYANVPTTQAVPLPDDASFDLGASLGIPFLTAHRCLTVTEDGPQRLGPGTLRGRVVLVAGGAGAVGNAAVQLARWSDATVITTVSSAEKAQYASAAGADHVVDYTRQDVVEVVRGIAPGGVHTVVEVAPGANAALDVAVLAQGGSVAMYANDKGDEVTLPVLPLMPVNARWQFVLVYTAPREWKLRAVDDVSAAVAAGAVRVGVDAGLPLHHHLLPEAAEAHAAVEGSAVGKVLVDVVA